MSRTREREEAAFHDVRVDLDGVVELMAFLLASAETCTREPYHYGTFRLLDGASRLAGIALRSVPDPEHHWLADLKRDIDDHKGLLMWDPEAYYAYVQAVTGKIVGHLTTASAS